MEYFVDYFVDWFVGGLPAWALAVSVWLGFLISLPRTTVVVTLGAPVAYWFWSSGLEDRIMNHVSNEGGAVTIGNLLDDLGVSVVDEADCSFASCSAYDAIDTLIAEDRLTIDLDPDLSKTLQQVVRLVNEKET